MLKPFLPNIAFLQKKTNCPLYIIVYKNRYSNNSEVTNLVTCVLWILSIN